MLGTATRLLGNAHLYVLLQKGLGADRLRYRCLDVLRLKPGDTVLDVGCGPAYYFERLGDARYFGFDTDPRYIEHAQRRWGERAQFRCAVFTEAHLADLPPIDKVLLLGLLHHLSDEESRALLGLVARALAPGGVVVSVDTCLEPRQGRVSRWMSENDRGEHVRRPDGFAALARASFGDVAGEVWSGVTRIPSSFWMMRMTAPLGGQAGQCPPTAANSSTYVPDAGVATGRSAEADSTE
jgi:SAM-dependent methyltransferase